MIANELKTTTDIVLYILRNFPKTRNSDNLLYVQVLNYYGAANGINIANMPVATFYLKIKELHVPSIETVGRCRRKIVETFPDLAGNDAVEEFRARKEDTFKEYAKGGVTQ